MAEGNTVRSFILGVLLGVSICANMFMFYMMSIKQESTMQLGNKYKMVIVKPK